MRDRWRSIGWDEMWARFCKEWTDGCNTVRDHQFRVTLHNGIHGTSQLMTFFDRHAQRMLRERWPEEEQTK